jgi:C4-dicarboxylate-binding protein DctP
VKGRLEYQHATRVTLRCEATKDREETMRMSLLAALAAGVLLASAPARAQQPIVIKFSHVVTPDTPKGKGAEKFKELAEKYTNGRAKVEIYPNSQLYKDKEEVEALQLGAVQMLAPSLAKFGPLGAKEFEVFDIPYILPDKAALRRVTDGALGKKLFTKLEPKGIKGLAYWDNGFKVMSANKPLRLPEDFRGLKMRIQSSKVLEAQMRALGAIPQVLAFSEAYQALQTGVCDGTENTASNEYTQKMHEVQKYTVLSGHGYIGYAVITNKKFWDGLPADVRGELEKAMAEATTYTNDIAQKENDEALAAMKQSGKTEIVSLTDEQKAAWRKALAPVADEMQSRVGKDTIEEFRREAGGATH